MNTWPRTNVPADHELVLAALDAGAAVYFEAPLGRTVAGAEVCPVR